MSNDWRKSDYQPPAERKAQEKAKRINQEELVRRLLQQHATMKRAFDQIGKIVDELSALAPYVDPVVVTGRRLEEFGYVLTLADIGQIMQRSPSYMQKLERAQRISGVRCLPEEIPGTKRYTQPAVLRWLKSGGIPAIVFENRRRKRSASRKEPSSSDTGQSD